MQTSVRLLLTALVISGITYAAAGPLPAATETAPAPQIAQAASGGEIGNGHSPSDLEPLIF